MKLLKEHRELLVKKLEYRFKNSDTGSELISKLNNNKELSDGELSTLLSKLEFRFKTSDAGKRFLKEVKA